METLPGRAHSYWVATSRAAEFPPLDHSLEVDVVVVGAGIVGLTTAFVLTARGLRVAVLEARRVGRGVSGHTTAKVTALHSARYHGLLEGHGREKASLYADANRAGLEWMAETIEDRAIDCAFTRAPAYTVGAGEEALRALEAEARALEAVDLPGVYLDGADLPAPMPARAGLRLADQAHFHPHRYLLALAEAVQAQGGRVWEDTRATDVSDEGGVCQVTTGRGLLRAESVVLATWMPFLRTTTLFTRNRPIGHAALSVKAKGRAPEGMFLSLDSEPHSLRPHPTGDGEVLIAASSGLHTGTGSTVRQTEDLTSAVRRRLDTGDVAYHWWTEDYYSVDGLPYVGRVGFHNRVFTATGFGGWGMTNGTAAGLLLADLVEGRDNPWADLYDPGRVTVSASQQAFLSQNIRVAWDFVGARLADRTGQVEAIGPGEGRILELDGRKVAVHRDPEGTVHAVSPVCRHMGCYVAWNDAERTWDCPCHGARYLPDGTMLHGPAKDDLPPIDIDTAAAPEPPGGPPEQHP